MTKALQGIAVMGVIGFVGLTLLAEGRSGSNAEGGENDGVDVNDAETGTAGTIVWSGSPYSVAVLKGSFNIGRETDNGFEALMGSNGLRYVYSEKSKAIEKAERLNNPQSGGFQIPQIEPAENKPAEPYERMTNPTDFGFGAPSPAFGW
tara:strand:- start:110 stop:556 length:447 start_codon:yes stop_codon:yes gene_type:complete